MDPHLLPTSCMLYRSIVFGNTNCPPIHPFPQTHSSIHGDDPKKNKKTRYYYFLSSHFDQLLRLFFLHVHFACLSNPFAIHSTPNHHKERSFNCNMCQKKGITWTLLLTWLGPWPGYSNDKGRCCLFLSFLLFLYPTQGSQATKKETKKKDIAGFLSFFFTLPLNLHTHTSPLCFSQTIHFCTSNHFSTSPHLRAYFYEDHSNEGKRKKQRMNEGRSAIQFHIPCFSLLLFIYSSACVFVCVCVNVYVILASQRTNICPDSKSRLLSSLSFSDKERYIRPSVRPMSPKHRLILAHPHWHSCTFIYNTRLSNHPPPILCLLPLLLPLSPSQPSNNQMHPPSTR